MTRNLLVQIGLAITVTLTASTLQAQQDELLADLYGRGVHAYFEGEFDTAHKLLSDAIEQKTEDPRCYYFRGATYTRLGRPDQATKDFQEGARLEAHDIQNTYPVNRSLQRVQGKVRITLETHRQQARLELRKYEEKRQRVRYETLKAAEKDVLRDPKPQPPANVPTVPDDAKLDPSNPFSGDEAGTLGGGTAQATKQNPAGQSSVATTRRRPELPTEPAATTQPAVAQPAAKPAGANPFGGAPAAKPAGANPFGGAPAAKPAGANPFGGAPAAKPAGANPFGGAPAAKPADPAKPAGANPFGGAPAAKPAQPEPGKPAANPFGAAPAANPGNAVEAEAEPAQKKGGAFGALFRATVKSIPGADTARKAIQGSPGQDEEVEATVEEEAPAAGDPAAKPAANPFGAAPGAKPAPAKPAANPFGADPGAKPAPAKPAPAKPAANPFGAP